MASKAEAKKARTKFKEQFWAKEPDKYNVIGIDCIEVLDEEEEMLDEGWHVVVYLFDMKDAENLPNEIDEVYIDYLPVMTKKEEE